MNSKDLIAPCGINCGVCFAYLREKNKCCGCRCGDIKKPKTRVNCKIKTCEFFAKSKKKYCFECDQFPCEKLKHLDKRYRTKYFMSMVENLKMIREIGIKKFLESEEIKWKCKKCGGIVCVHTGKCISCS